jgi:hypothetical protein
LFIPSLPFFFFFFFSFSLLITHLSSLGALPSDSWMMIAHSRAYVIGWYLQLVKSAHSRCPLLFSFFFGRVKRACFALSFSHVLCFSRDDSRSTIEKWLFTYIHHESSVTCTI